MGTSENGVELSRALLDRNAIVRQRFLADYEHQHLSRLAGCSSLYNRAHRVLRCRAHLCCTHSHCELFVVAQRPRRHGHRWALGRGGQTRLHRGQLAAGEPIQPGPQICAQPLPVVAELADTLGRGVDIAAQHPDRRPRLQGTVVDGYTQGLPVERMTRRCAAPKITQIQRRFASSRFAADTALLI